MARLIARHLCGCAEKRIARWLQGARNFVEAKTPVGFKVTPMADHPECAVCKTYLYLHAVECPASGGSRYCCAHHFHALSTKGPAKWVVHFRHSLHELNALVAATYARAAPVGDASAVQLARWRPPVLIGKDDAPAFVVPERFLPSKAAAAASPAALPAAAAAAVAAVKQEDRVEDEVRAVVWECVDRACAGEVPPDDSEMSHQTVAVTGIEDDGDDGVGGYETRHVACPALVRAAVSETEAEWHGRVRAALERGGIKPAMLQSLIAEGEALKWAEVDGGKLADALERLLAARRWFSDVQVLSVPLVRAAGLLEGIVCMHRSTGTVRTVARC
jgi:hypothetical protein